MNSHMGEYTAATFDGVQVDIYRGRDGVLVVDILTQDCADKDHNPDTTPRMRVYLNDDSVYESPALPEQLDTVEQMELERNIRKFTPPD